MQRTAVVTGGAHGLGQASALRLATDNRVIAIWDRDPDGAVETVDRIEAAGGTAIACTVDVSCEQTMRDALQETHDRLGAVDILVNAAGIIGADATVLETPIQEWHDVLAVNLTGTYVACRLVVSEMASRGWGRIVNFTSHARRGTPSLIPYSVSKAGLVPLTRALALEFTSSGVLVNAVQPGRAMTDMVLSRVPPEVVRDPSVAIGRYAEPEEVAEVVTFLCAEHNTYMSGGVVPVDGGA